jgi:hypothetical protein
VPCASFLQNAPAFIRVVASLVPQFLFAWASEAVLKLF